MGVGPATVFMLFTKVILKGSSFVDDMFINIWIGGLCYVSLCCWA